MSAEFEEIADKKAKQLENKFKANGCGTEVGCFFGKKHVQMHGDKLDSDINNLKEYQKRQEKENRDVTKKLSEAIMSFHEVLGDLSSLLKKVNVLKSEMKDDIVSSEKRSTEGIKEAKEIGNNANKGLFRITILMLIAALGWAGAAAGFLISNLSEKSEKEKVSENVAKINSVDIANQKSLEVYLATLTAHLSGKPVAEVIAEHEKLFKKKATQPEK